MVNFRTFYVMRKLSKSVCPCRFAGNYFISVRGIFSVCGSLEPELTHEVKKDIEKFWKDKINITEEPQVGKPKYYVLSMFPYPSGFLHMGHVRVYTLSDAVARFQRMRGKNVIHPIGWDAFGLPAENAAIEKQVHPAEWTAKNIDAMKQQLQMLNISFDWDRELSTCDPSYYKWTQYFFLLMYDKGLAYKKQAVVNWDPVDQTVLADEQVDEEGRSWRSGCKVEKKRLEQWFLRTTEYGKNLYDGLSSPDLQEWRDVTKIQKHWIGKCNGYTMHLKVLHNGTELNDTLSVWTSTPEHIFGAAFVAVSPENHFNTELYGGSGSSGDHLLEIEAVHPLTERLMPVIVTSQLQCTPATDSVLGIPGEGDENMFGFAMKHDLDMIPVTNKATKRLINSEEFSGMTAEDARSKIIEKMKSTGTRIYPSSQKLRDWLISRQRYWGTPIPIINCPKCKTVPVPYSDLPVLLPHLKEFSGKGSSLKSAGDWIHVKCPKCGGDACRETDTMDTFVDSSWYFLRYLDVNNDSAPFDIMKIKQSMPVDLYVGGKEHAALHLFYARFMAHFCHSIGMLEKPEPFVQLLMQGMVQGQSYRIKSTGKYIKKEDVDFSGSKPVEKSTGSPVIVEWEKMSKSKFNGIDPEQVIKEHGIDTTRLFILGSVAPESPRKWNDELFLGIWKWQRKVWLTVSEFVAYREGKGKPQELTPEEKEKLEYELRDARNYYVKKSLHNYLNTRQLSVVIAKLQGLTGDLRRLSRGLARDSEIYEETLAALLVMLAPLAPHFASELWSAFCSVATGGRQYRLDKPVLHQPFPKYDDDYGFNLVVKLNDNKVDLIPIQKAELESLNKDSAANIAFTSEKLKEMTRNSKIISMKFRTRPEYDPEINIVHIPAKTDSKGKKSAIAS